MASQIPPRLDHRVDCKMPAAWERANRSKRKKQRTIKTVTAPSNPKLTQNGIAAIDQLEKPCSFRSKIWVVKRGERAGAFSEISFVTVWANDSVDLKIKVRESKLLQLENENDKHGRSLERTQPKLTSIIIKGQVKLDRSVEEEIYGG